MAAPFFETIDLAPLTLTEAFIEDFESRVYHLGQQAVSRLRPTVRNRTGTGDAFNWERMASTEMLNKILRLQASDATNSPASSRRRAQVETWNWQAGVDHSDLVRTIIDPESEYVRAAGAAYGRRIDAVIAAAAVADSAVGIGSAPGPTVAFPAGQVIGTGAALTLDLLREAKRLLDEAEVGVMQGGERCLAITAKGLQDLLAVTEVTSVDFNSVKALVDGTLNTFLGFNIVRTEILPGSTTSPIAVPVDSLANITATGCLAYERSAIGLAFADDKFTRIAEDPGLEFSTRIYMEMTLGAVRLEETGVVAIDIAS